MRQDPKETIFNTILNLNTEDPHYFSNLFRLSILLFDDEDHQILEKKLDEICQMLSVTQERPSIYYLETMLANRASNDFVKVKNKPYGHKYLYVHQVQDKLNEVSLWVMERLKKYMGKIRFYKQINL